MGLLRSVLVCIILFFSAYFGSLFMQGPFLWLAVVSPKTFRTWMDITVASWMTLAAGTLELIGGIRMRHFGDPLTRERAVLILNHRTRCDWFYLWSILVRCRCLRQEKIVLKDDLSRIPGPGWAMQCACFIFLKRRWEQDCKVIHDFIDYFISLDHKCQILIFPEGTNLNNYTKKKSDAYALEHNLPKYQYVLHPRTTGFVSLVNQMREGGSLDAIYDITVAYPANFPENEIQFITGNQPAEVNFHVCRFDNDALPLDKNDLASWLQNRWADKEKDLANYYSTVGSTTNLSEGFTDATHLCDYDRFYLACTIIYWIIYLMLIIHFVVFTSIGKCLFVILNLVYVVLGAYFGGIDKWAVYRVIDQSKRY